MLGDLVVKTVQNLSLNLAYCIRTGTDACSVITSVVCRAISTIQRAVPRAVRCPWLSHALNLSISKLSSVQCVQNAKGTVSFFKALAKQNFVWKHVGHGQLTSLCETRWIERHDCILQFCWELPRIVEALLIVANWHERASVWTLVLVVIYRDLLCYFVYWPQGCNKLELSWDELSVGF